MSAPNKRVLFLQQHEFSSKFRNLARRATKTSVLWRAVDSEWTAPCGGDGYLLSL